MCGRSEDVDLNTYIRQDGETLRTWGKLDKNATIQATDIILSTFFFALMV